MQNTTNNKYEFQSANVNERLVLPTSDRLCRTVIWLVSTVGETGTFVSATKKFDNSAQFLLDVR